MSIQIKVNENVVTNIPMDGKEYEVKIYISYDYKNGTQYKLHCVTIGTVQEHMRGKYTGLTIE